MAGAEGGLGAGLGTRLGAGLGETGTSATARCSSPRRSRCAGCGCLANKRASAATRSSSVDGSSGGWGASGLANKASVSLIETGARAPDLAQALAIERLSVADGAPRIDAALLNDDVARARAACAGGCSVAEPVAECQAGDAVSSHGDADSATDASASTGLSGEMSRDPLTCSGQGVVA